MKMYSEKLNIDEVIEGSLGDRMIHLEETKPKTAEALKRYREKLFNSEEMKEGLKLIDNYREAYREKENSGLFDEMELAERYWSGDFGVPEDYDDPGSNTNIINTNIETQVASMVDQAIDIELKPYEPTDRPYVQKSRMILDRIKDVNQLPKKIEDWERKKDKFGTGIFRVMYNPKLLDGIGCPEIRVCNPAYVFPDPNIKCLEDIQEGEFIIQTLPKSLYWAEKKFGRERAWAIAPGYNPIDANMVFGEDDTPNYDITGDHYLHILYFTKIYKVPYKNPRLRLIQLSGCGIILDDTEKDGSEFNYFTDDGKYPFFFTVDMRREGTIWGKSNCSLLFSLQDEIDDYTNQIRRNARLTGNPIKLISDTANVETDKLDNTAGMNIVLHDINGVKFLQPPSMPQYLIDRRAQAMTERVIISRISDQQAGIKQAGVQTATESLNLAQSANVATDTKKVMLQYTLNDVFSYCFDLALEYWNIGMFFNTEDEEFEYFKPSDLKNIPMMKPATNSYINKFLRKNPDKEPPKYMLNSKEKRRIKLIFNIQVGAGLPTNKATAFSYVLESFKAGLISKKECRELMIEYIKLPVETVDNIVIALEEKQIEYQMKLLDAQMMNAGQVQVPQPMEQGEVQMQPIERTTAVANPRPNTINKLNNEKVV